MKRFFLLALSAGLLSSCSTSTIQKDPKLLCANLAANYEKHQNDSSYVRYLSRRKGEVIGTSEYSKINRNWNNAKERLKNRKEKMDDIMQEIAILRGEKKSEVIRYRKVIRNFWNSDRSKETRRDRDKFLEAERSDFFNVQAGYQTFCEQYDILCLLIVCIALHLYRVYFYLHVR